MDYKEKLEKAIAYVRENKTWSEAEEAVALERINHFRCDVADTSMGIADKIADLMCEWSDDNGEESDWWEEYTDVEEIFWEL